MGDAEDVKDYEENIERLKHEYMQYFSRIVKREPTKLRSDVDRQGRLFVTRVMNNTGVKFRLQGLQARYNTYKHYWTRILREIEDGNYWKKIAAGGAPPVMPGVAKLPDMDVAKSNSGGDVFDDFVNAKKQLHQSVEGLTKDQFLKQIEAQKKKLGRDDLDVKINVKDGKAKISFVPKKK